MALFCEECERGWANGSENLGLPEGSHKFGEYFTPLPFGILDPPLPLQGGEFHA